MNKILVAILILMSVGCATTSPLVEEQGQTLNQFLQEGFRGQSAIVSGSEIVILHNGQVDGKWCRQYSRDGIVKAACQSEKGQWVETALK